MDSNTTNRDRSSYATFLNDAAASSPQLTATDHKKKQGLFGSKKSKPVALERPKTSPSVSMVTSPLPVSTPVKAAKFFGFGTKPPVTEDPHRVQQQDELASDDEAPVRPTLKKQLSSPLLIRLKEIASRQTKVKKEEVELDEPPKASKSATMGLRMLIPEFASSRRSPIEKTKAATTRFDLDDEDQDVDHTGETHQDVRFRIPAAPHPVRTSSKKKAAWRKPLNMKDFPRMSPITEASFESLRPAYHEDEDVTELGVISEYEYEDSQHSAPVPPHSHAGQSRHAHEAFELDEADLSPTDNLYDEEAVDEDEDVVHPGTKVKVKHVNWQQATAVRFRSPLQSAEDAWLGATEEEMRLEASRMVIARVEKEKLAMDAEIAELRRKHEQYKLDFANGSYAEHSKVDPEVTADDGSEGDDSDLVSLRSSIDLDEEPTVHEAKVVTFTRITPGMVKLIDIPPRKKKPVARIESDTVASDQLPRAEPQKKSIAALASSENIPPPSVSTYSRPLTP